MNVDFTDNVCDTYLGVVVRLLIVRIPPNLNRTEHTKH